MASQAVEMDLTIIGYDNWRQLVPQTISTPDGKAISFDQYVQDICDKDSQITQENAIVSYFYRLRVNLFPDIPSQEIFRYWSQPVFGIKEPV